MASDGIEAEVDEAELDGVIKAEWESTGLLALPSAVCCSCARSSLFLMVNNLLVLGKSKQV